jgi:transglutaminase-like putative cysteine protease
MREAGRTALIVVVPGVLIAYSWARLEKPSPPPGQLLWIVLLGLAPALFPRLSMRLVAAFVAFLLAADTALRVSVLDARPFDGHHAFFGPLLSHFGTGLGNYYDVALPFDRHENVYMHGVALLAIFAGCLCVGLLVAARRPGGAALSLLVWAAWPMTLLTGPGDLRRGAFVLAGVLLLLATVRPAPGRRAGLAVGVAGVLVLVSLGVSTSPAIAKGEFLDWQTWDFYTQPDTPVGVQYVWDMTFDGITFPKKVTPVFRVQGPETPHYWRATTLDTFAAQHWFEGDLGTVVPDRTRGRDVLTADPFLPTAARNPHRWVRQTVTMAALRDDHLLAATTPVAYARGDLAALSYEDSGVALSEQMLSRDQTYTVWSYAPEPTPKQLEASKALYPEGTPRYLELEPGMIAEPFGTPGRVRDLDTMESQSGDVAQYAPLYRIARRVAGDAANPYAATVAVEAWFRSNPNFTYNQHPHVPLGVPPLVWFVTQGKTGYCQFYAGAMALMLRSLGIPARVAAGFTSGKYDPKSHTWTVTDHDAHMWVEAWFRGYGWLTFDPTPSRGVLGGTYSTASPGFDVVGAGLLAVARRLGLTGFDVKRTNDFGFPQGGLGGFQSDVPRKGGGGVTTVITGAGRNASLARLLALIAVGALALLALVKAVRRRGRYLTRDPRRIAAACRREITDFLLDQGIAVGRSATPHELSALVRRELGVDSTAFASAVAGARFGPPERAADEARRACAERRRVVHAIRRRLPWTRRTIGLVSLRSLGVTR